MLFPSSLGPVTEFPLIPELVKKGTLWRESGRRQEGTKEILLVLSGLFLISKVN